MSLNYQALVKQAFPDHIVSLKEVREYAYARKAGTRGEPRIADHIEACTVCLKEVVNLLLTDPLLSGTDGRLKVVVHQTS